MSNESALAKAQSITDEADALSRRCRTSTKSDLLAELAIIRHRAKDLPRRHQGDYGYQTDAHLDTVEGRINRRCKQ